MDQLYPAAVSTLSLPPETYIYSLVPISNSIAAISSDDSLRIFDADTLGLLPNGVRSNIHAGTTCLKQYDAEGNTLITAGRDGAVRIWDLRSQDIVGEFKRDMATALLSLDCRIDTNAVVAGTELSGHDAAVVMWDTRLMTRPRQQYVESHNDDVTDLHFHPAHPSFLLSGSTDGLLNVYDTTITNEDDALYQVINHGSSIHLTGFLDDTGIFGLSHDETLSIYELANLVDDTAEKSPTVFGDIRAKLNCEYVIGVIPGKARGGWIVTGSHSEHRVDVIPLGPRPDWNLEEGGGVRLPSAHGEEIVRSILLDTQSHTVYTAGEDGLVRVWKSRDSSEQVVKRGPKQKRWGRVQDTRFRPY